jgi:hypothetical protein
MSDLNCSEYSEKAIVVRGEATKTYKEDLKTLGGKYNASLKGGAGWIFSKTSEGKVNKFITSVKNGQVTPTSPKPFRSSQAEVRTSQSEVRSLKFTSSSDYTSILQDISIFMEGKDPEYKLSFLSSVTLLLSKGAPVAPVAPVAVPERVLSKKPVQYCESVVIESDDEEEAPPRRRLLK